jgi:DNA-binding MarR family transcriptional regulator
LNQETADEILSENKWPDYFDKYETLLRLGYDAGIRVGFADPLGDSSLRWTIIDLAKEHPGIAISDIAKLLNIDKTIALQLAKKAVKDERVHITFDE